MSGCGRHNKQLNAWLEISEDERQVVRKHAAGCTSCQNELAEIEHLQQVIDAGVRDYRAVEYRGPRPVFTEVAAEAPAWGPGLRWAAAGALILIAVLWLRPGDQAEIEPIARDGAPSMAYAKSTISYGAISRLRPETSVSSEDVYRAVSHARKAVSFSVPSMPSVPKRPDNKLHGSGAVTMPEERQT